MEIAKVMYAEKNVKDNQSTVATVKWQPSTKSVEISKVLNKMYQHNFCKIFFSSQKVFCCSQRSILQINYRGCSDRNYPVSIKNLFSSKIDKC